MDAATNNKYKTNKGKTKTNRGELRCSWRIVMYQRL